MKRSLFASLAVTLALIAALGVVLTASAGGLAFGPKTDYATAAPASYNFNLHDVVAADFNHLALAKVISATIRTKLVHLEAEVLLKDSRLMLLQACFQRSL